MAGKSKKRNVENENSEGSSESENEEIYTGGEVIQADFEGRNPEGIDFHGIKQLLQQLFLKAHINLSEMSDLIIAQSNVGSVLKQTVDDDMDDDDDEMSSLNDVFGVTTIINITEKKDVDCVAQFRNLLIELSNEHASKEIADQIESLLNNPSNQIGLLINERFVNIPPKIADPLLNSLLNEIDRAIKKKWNFKFDYCILISKFYKAVKSKEILYSNPEEEIFDNEADIKFEFSVKNQSDSGVSGNWLEDDIEMTPFRKVIIFKSNKLTNIVEKVKQFVA